MALPGQIGQGGGNLAVVAHVLVGADFEGTAQHDQGLAPAVVVGGVGRP